jgi:hypothetical protein
LVVLTLVASGPAAAYRCEDPPPVSMPHPELPGRELPVSSSSTECRVPQDNDRVIGRTKKRGSMSSLTVLVLAVAAVLLIPIGALRIPSNVDPYSGDRRDY